MDLFEYAKQQEENEAKAEGPAKADPEPSSNKDEAIVTVSELTSAVKKTLVSTFGRENFWVKGEISNYRGRHSSGHMYFRLKDENAVINAVFFKHC